LPSCKSDFIMCAWNETVTALLLLVLEKRIQPTQLKFGHAKIATLLPVQNYHEMFPCFHSVLDHWRN
jgi:hypothetical protein